MSTGSTNTLGKYEIVREIGRSNDVVYEAIDPSINRRVALKELAVPANVTGAQRRERIERFWREGKAAGKLAHPNIVTVYEVGKENDRYFIAMEFLEGQTLRDVMQAGGMLSIKDATNYAIQLCSALAYAHEHGVVHRDIKPENVQIVPGGHVKLTDFGIARLMGEAPITQDGQVFGTPSYMSPEQVAGKSTDARSDIFSLGVMLYEMVAGSKPFSGDSIVTVTYNIMNMEAPPPQGAPPWLAGVIRKAMSKDPNARYSSAEEMAEDMREEKCGSAFNPIGNGYAVGGGYGVPPQQGGAYPSPFGGASQGPFQQPPGAYQPPPPGPLTPYGTPMPSSSAGSPPVAVPDPFASRVPQPPTAAPGPPAPMVSSETRNFLGVFAIIIGFAGMLIFAIFAVNLAYSSYQRSVNGEHAAKYLAQGTKLYGKGDYDGAIDQWKSAVRVGPDTKPGRTADDNIYKVLVKRTYNAATQGGGDVTSQAQELIDMRPKSPEGHYYMGYACELRRDPAAACESYKKAVEYGGNDQFAISARERLNALGAATPSAPPASTAPAPPPPSSGDNTGVPFQPAP